MLSGKGNENGEKTAIGLGQLCTCSTLFFCKFLLHDYNVKPETAWLHVLWRKSESYVFFHVAHFHPGGRKHISFSHRRYKLSCCSSYKQSPLLFSLGLALFLVELRCPIALLSLFSVFLLLYILNLWT